MENSKHIQSQTSGSSSSQPLNQPTNKEIESPEKRVAKEVFSQAADMGKLTQTIRFMDPWVSSQQSLIATQKSLHPVVFVEGDVMISLEEVHRKMQAANSPVPVNEFKETLEKLYPSLQISDLDQYMLELNEDFDPNNPDDKDLLDLIVTGNEILNYALNEGLKSLPLVDEDVADWLNDVEVVFYKLKNNQSLDESMKSKKDILQKLSDLNYFSPFRDFEIALDDLEKGLEDIAKKLPEDKKKVVNDLIQLVKEGKKLDQSSELNDWFSKATSLSEKMAYIYELGQKAEIMGDIQDLQNALRVYQFIDKGKQLISKAEESSQNQLPFSALQPLLKEAEFLYNLTVKDDSMVDQNSVLLSLKKLQDIPDSILQHVNYSVTFASSRNDLKHEIMSAFSSVAFPETTKNQPPEKKMVDQEVKIQKFQKYLNAIIFGYGPFLKSDHVNKICVQIQEYLTNPKNDWGLSPDEISPFKKALDSISNNAETHSDRYVQLSPLIEHVLHTFENAPELNQIIALGIMHSWVENLDIPIGEKIAAVKMNREGYRGLIAQDWAQAMGMGHLVPPKQKANLMSKVLVEKEETLESGYKYIKSTEIKPEGFVSPVVQNTARVTALMTALNESDKRVKAAAVILDIAKVSGNVEAIQKAEDVLKSLQNAFIAVSKNCQRAIDLSSYQEMCFFLGIIGEFDAHTDQFYLEGKKVGNLDVERHSAPGDAVITKEGEVLPLFRNALLDMPQMDEPLDPVTRQKILDINLGKLQKQMESHLLKPVDETTQQIRTVSKNKHWLIDLSDNLSTENTLSPNEKDLLKSLWISKGGSQKQFHYIMDKLNDPELIISSLIRHFEGKMVQLKRQQDTFQSIDPKAFEIQIGRVKRVQEHLLKDPKATTRSIMNAIYPEGMLFYEALKKWVFKAGNEFGYSHQMWTCEKIIKEIEAKNKENEAKKLPPLVSDQELKKLKEAKEALKKRAFEWSYLKTITGNHT